MTYSAKEVFLTVQGEGEGIQRPHTLLVPLTWLLR